MLFSLLLLSGAMIAQEKEAVPAQDKSGDEAPSGSYAAIVTGKDQNGKSFRDIQLFELRR